MPARVWGFEFSFGTTELHALAGLALPTTLQQPARLGRCCAETHGATFSLLRVATTVAGIERSRRAGSSAAMHIHRSGWSARCRSPVPAQLSFPFHFQMGGCFRGILRFSGVSRCVVKRRENPGKHCFFGGGRSRARTCDPGLVRAVLSQLSYPPVSENLRGYVTPVNRIRPTMFVNPPGLPRASLAGPTWSPPGAAAGSRSDEPASATSC